MPTRPCLEPGCPKLTSHGSRCPEHQRQYTARREQQRGNRHARGYDNDWLRLSHQVIADQPWCSYCGTAGTIDNPLTADHIAPLARGGVSVAENVQVVCRRCNGAKGAR